MSRRSHHSLRPRDVHMMNNSVLGVRHRGEHPGAVLRLPGSGGADVLTGTSTTSRRARYGLPGVVVKPNAANGLKKATFFELAPRLVALAVFDSSRHIGRLSSADYRRIRRELERMHPPSS